MTTTQRDPTFNKSRVNNVWEINRPAYRAGTQKTSPNSVSMPVDIRRGTGNYEIRRKNFIAPPVRSRASSLNFDRINAINLAKFGQKVSLSEKTLLDLIGINLPDPSDISWIAEYNRRKAAGETEEQLKINPPLGRQQRTIQKKINIAEARVSFDEGIQIIRKLLTQGRTESIAQRAVLGAEVAKVLSRIDDLQRSSDSDFAIIMDAITRVNLPPDLAAAGIDNRLISIALYGQESGRINLTLLSNIERFNQEFQTSLTPQQPVIGSRGNPITLSSMENALSQRGKILDLENRRLISLTEARRLADTGVDGGVIVGVPEEERKEARAPDPEEEEEEEELTFEPAGIARAPTREEAAAQRALEREIGRQFEV